MSREVSNDCGILISFLKEYSLTQLFENPQYVTELKSVHKKVYGYLLFITEIEQRTLDSNMALEYYKESGSDLMQSIFCWANGSYKSSKLMLRSAIETFIKASLGNDIPEVFEEKSLYRLFDLAKSHRCYSGEIREKYFNKIHSSYKILCMTAHSAPTIDLATVSSMKMLPRYDSSSSKEYSILLINVIESVLSLILINHYSTVHSMHTLNRDIFLSTLTLTSKREIIESMSIA